MSHVEGWIAQRMRSIESSGIRKVMELARSLKEPVNLSIGLPDFDVPAEAKEAAKRAIDAGHNAYTVTQGIPALRERLLADVRRRLPHADRQLVVTSGTSGGLMLALFCFVNPGDEVVVFDPYFVMYPHLVTLAGGTTVYVDTYPDFAPDVSRVESALSARTKAIIVNSPGNPTGHVWPRETMNAVAQLARKRNILLLSDEVYSLFCHDGPFCSPAEFNEDVLVFDGFSKSHGMTGWRLGFCHGPKALIHEMVKLQQFSFVCAPSMVQHAGLTAWGLDRSAVAADYRRKRDRLRDGLKGRFELAESEGAFYLFPRAPWGTGTEFVAECIRNNLLVIPGNVFSRQDTHFRVSYAADDAALDKGIAILNKVAGAKPQAAR